MIMELIVGMPDSGKSKLAEERAMALAQDGKKYYIATMIPYGKEGADRVAKHRKMRDGKGFLTLEWTEDIAKKVRDCNDLCDATVLLECMSNLIGNEMYSPQNKGQSKDRLLDIIMDEVMSLKNKAKNLVVVTNIFPMMQEGYDAETIRYVELVDAVNQKLKAEAQVIYQFEEGEWRRYENS